MQSGKRRRSFPAPTARPSFSCTQASVAESKRQTLTPDEKQASRVTPPPLLQFAEGVAERCVSPAG